MMNVYLDTSVVLGRLFGESRAFFPEWGRWQSAYSSELLGLESRRMIDRLRLQGSLNDRSVALGHERLAGLERGIGYIGLTRQVFNRAGLPMPTVVKTLDAIHLASALLFSENREESLVFATHDRRQANAARALGFEVIGHEFDE